MTKKSIKIDFKIGDAYKFFTVRDIVKNIVYCNCICGNEFKFKCYEYTGNKNCGCKRKESIENNLYPKKGLYTYYKLNAKRRNIPFEISLEDFSNLIEEKCFYCKSQKESRIKFSKKTDKYERYYNYTGVDRFDNSKGYSKENCVTCCKKCNASKLDLSFDEWFNWVKLVYENFAKE